MSLDKTKKRGEITKVGKSSETDQEKEFKSSGVEGEKQQEDAEVKKKPGPEIVRGEDVLKILRSKGYKI